MSISLCSICIFDQTSDALARVFWWYYAKKVIPFHELSGNPLRYLQLVHFAVMIKTHGAVKWALLLKISHQEIYLG